jgi:hypothetical protein
MRRTSWIFATMAGLLLAACDARQDTQTTGGAGTETGAGTTTDTTTMAPGTGATDTSMRAPGMDTAADTAPGR